MSEQIFIEFHTRWFYLPTMIAIAFLIASASVIHCVKQMKDLYKSLDEDQRKIYKEISKEREKLYWCALLQGCFIAILYIIMTTMTCGVSKSLYHLVSDVLCIILATAYFVYTLKDKQKFLINEAELDENQDKKWFTLYRCMQVSFWGHFLMGLLFSAFIFQMLDIVSPPIHVCINPTSPPLTKLLKKKVIRIRNKQRWKNWNMLATLLEE